MASKMEEMIRGAVTKGVMKVAAFNRDRKEAPDAPHPYLSGIHTPLEDQFTLDALAVSGTIPPELDGSYVRNGPNPAAAPNPATYHWFTGAGMVHGVRLQGGKALWYRNRWIRGAEASARLGVPPLPGAEPFGTDAPNTNVLGHAGSIWALVEAGGAPVRLDANLESIAYDRFGDSLKGSFSAHPHLDPDSGEMHAICYEGKDPTTIRHVVLNAAGRVRREEPIAVQHGPSIHDCMITKNYVIILDLPVTFSMKTLLAGHAFPYKWNPDHKARVGLMPKDGTNADVIWCDVAPCYVFHPCNAYEQEDGTITMHVCAHETMFAESTQGPDSQSVPFERWSIDPVARSVSRTVIDASPQEFPRPNETLLGKPYRYAYVLGFKEGDNGLFSNETMLLKHDLESGSRQVHDFGPQRFSGEFVFVPKANGVAEDDGWLMGYVIDMDSKTTDLVILDAANFEGPPQATITIPHRIPPGFHGNWIAA